MSNIPQDEELLLQNEEDEETEAEARTVYGDSRGGENPYNTKKNHLLTLLAMFILAVALTAAGYLDDRNMLAPFHPVLDVVLMNESAAQGGYTVYEGTSYVTVGADGRYREREPFEGGGSACFVTGIYEHDQEKLNFLTDRTLSPNASRTSQAEAEAAENDPVIGRILDLIERTETEHAIIRARLYVLDGGYFACVDRNVNLWTPYVLYYYSPERDALMKLATFDGKVVADLQLRVEFYERVGW